MEKLCKELTSTYDTNILDNEDKTVQDKFLNVSRKIEKIKVEKKFLCNLYVIIMMKMYKN